MENQEVGEGELLFLKGLGRKCPFCGVWSRHEKPEGSGKKVCFTVVCPSCHRSFEITQGVRPTYGN